MFFLERSVPNFSNSKDELTIAVKALADTARQLANVYAKQQKQIEQLVKKVDELEKGRK